MVWALHQHPLCPLAKWNYWVLETNFTHCGRATQHLQQRSEWTGCQALQHMQHPFCIYQTVLCISRFPQECIELLYFEQMVSDTEPPYHFVICCILSFVCIAFHAVKSFVLDMGHHLRSSSVSDIDEYDNWQDKWCTLCYTHLCLCLNSGKQWLQAARNL